MKRLVVGYRQMDLAVECACGAKPGKKCKDTLSKSKLQPGQVHIARRIKWLLKTVDARARGTLVVR
jgi:hypothetical protein